MRSPRGDTIVAIATPSGVGAVGLIRISGPRAIPLASRVIRLTGPRSLESATPRVLLRASVTDPRTGETLDEALVVRMPAPRSYTGEDVVELSCHGNPTLLAEIVRLLIQDGGRLAEPGEFTQRAFLNGRLDLLQAEAVAALIRARTERAVRLAARQIQGPFSREIREVRDRLLDLVAGLEVALDFPDDGVGISDTSAVKLLDELEADLTALRARAIQGRAVHDALVVLLTGRPNVGKSSLLNALVESERAIVSPSPGTTRDLIETSIVIRGVSVRLLDGAGLGPVQDAVDAEGMRRTRNAIRECDLIVAVFDRSSAMSDDDREVLRLIADRPRILVANKEDLTSVWEDAGPCEIVCSAKTGWGVDQLKERLASWVSDRTGEDGEEGGIVVSLRVLERLETATAAIVTARGAMPLVPIEAVLVDLRAGAASLGELLGIGVDDDVLDRIFAGFCVGK